MRVSLLSFRGFVGLFDLAFAKLVCVDNPLDERMADDVFLFIFNNANPLYALENPEGVEQTAADRPREVDLGDVAGHDHLGIDSEAREEHLHLVGGRVLRLVKDNDRVVERPASHEGKRSNLDRVGIHIFLELHRGNHILEGVVKRLEIRVDLIFHVAGEEAEFLAGLDGGAGEDKSAAFLVFQGSDSEGDCDVGFSRSGGAEGKRKVVFAEGFHHFSLIGVAGGDRAAVLAVDDHTLRVELAGSFSANDVDDGILRQTVVFGGVCLDFLYFLFKVRRFVFFAEHLDDIAACGNPQLREEVADEGYVSIVDPVESLGVDAIDYYDSFNHVLI